MTMKKSWMMMKDRTDKQHKEQEEACSTNEVILDGAVCDLSAQYNTCLLTYFSCIVEYYILIFWQNKVMMIMESTEVGEE